ncbi:MAG: rRNA pseudouridine synthase [Syntrophobacterales bacterium]|nr:MAG: rRNA pseudouridine synthase [Syntrophobacterales bacterium]
MKERLQKILSKSGFTSRRHAERLIVDGRIKVNGVVVTSLGFKADPHRDHIRVDGKPIGKFEPKGCLLLNKPRGCVTTLDDPLGRPTIRDFLHGEKRRVYPVGRLDFDSEGLLILTNDGELHQRLTHPKYGVPRTYLVKTKGIPDPEAMRRIRNGLTLEDGVTLPARVRLVKRLKRNSWMRLTVYEGRNKLIKRMCAAISHPVIRLKRIRYGSLTLGDLKPGKYRYLTSREIEELKSDWISTKGVEE